jgi:hypothetical protein
MNVFTAGPKRDSAPAGSIEREAVDSLRGYAYQIAASALAWLGLRPNEILYLEVAEDYSICAENTVTAVQVKDTKQSGNVTLNSQNVRAAFENFIELTERNPSAQVHLRFLTTSDIGLEQSLDDRPNGEAGLKYWRRVAAAGEITPLRTLLSAEGMPERLRAFVNARDDAKLRDELLRRIHWDCGAPSYNHIQEELESSLAILARQRFGIPSSSAKRLTYAVLYHVLRKATLKERDKRYLTAAELDAFLDEMSRISVRQADFDRLTSLAAAFSGGYGNGISVSEGSRPSWIFLDSELIAPKLSIKRAALMDAAQNGLLLASTIILSGATGLGKSLLAREVAFAAGGGFAVVDLRDLQPSDIQKRLSTLIPYITELKVRTIIFDDLNHLDEQAVRRSFGRVLASLELRDLLSIVTCYRTPSSQTASEIGVPVSSLVELTYFSQEEVDRIVQLAGGDPKIWGRIAYMAGGEGHPQLVKAFVLGMSARSWPQSELQQIIKAGFSTPDISASRDEARSRLIAGLPDDSRTLLFRVSLIVGSFVRGLAIKLGEISPQLRKAGELLISLTGSWVETIDSERLRVSPLISRAGIGVLSDEECRAVHSAIARYLVKDHKLSITDADTLFLHATLGHDHAMLMVVAQATISATQETLEALGDYTYALPNLSTHQLVVPENAAISVLLRVAQCRIAVAKRDAALTVSAFNALTREIEAVDHVARGGLSAIATMSLVSLPGAAAYIPNWLDVLRNFKELAATDRQMSKLMKAVPAPPGQEYRTVPGVLFFIGLTKLPTVAKLEEVFDQLDKLPSNERDNLFAEFEISPSDYDLVVSGPWLAEQVSGTLNWSDAAERYLSLAVQAAGWGKPILSAYCHKARSVMMDEYGNDSTAALAALSDAEKVLGKNEVLTRERIKILWRRDDYQQVVDIVTPIADVIAKDNPTERMFVLREAAICAGSLEQWKLAALWFREARTAIAQSPILQPTAIGLMTDEAVAEFKDGNSARCLELLEAALQALPRIDQDQSLKACYCKHVVRHTILWFKLHCEAALPTTLDFEITWQPGAGSNPLPSEAIKTRPLGSIDLAWYMLAEAEILCGLDLGIRKNLKKRLAGGPILFEELSVGSTTINAAIRRLAVEQFTCNLYPYVEGQAYFRLNVQALSDLFNVMNPQRGGVPSISPKELQLKPNAQQDGDQAILSFAISAILNDRVIELDAVEEKLRGGYGNDFLGHRAFAALKGTEKAENELQGEVVRILGILRTGEYLVPSDICGVALRFSEFAFQSNFKDELVEIIWRWFSHRWKHILAAERFRLKSPSLFGPQIEVVLADAAFTSEQRLSKLLLIGCEAAGLGLANEYQERLSNRARGPSSKL